MSSVPAHLLAPRRSTAAPAASRSPALGRPASGRSAQHLGAALAARPRRGSGARRRASRSARGRSPPRPSGRCPSSRRSRSPPGSKQLTATMNASFAARGVVAVGVRPAEEHAGPGSRSRAARRSARRGTRAAGPSAAPPRRRSRRRCARARQSRTRGGQQELLPRVRPDRVAEARLVVAALEAVACPPPGRRSSRSGARPRTRGRRRRSRRRARSGRRCEIRAPRAPSGDRPEPRARSRSMRRQAGASTPRPSPGLGPYPIPAAWANPAAVCGGGVEWLGVAVAADVWANVAGVSHRPNGIHSHDGQLASLEATQSKGSTTM